MGKATLLKVGNKNVKSTEVTYDDLIILYQQYIDTYGEVPLTAKCDLKHNMPQGRIIKRVLEENNVTYNDFLLKFGKVSHVRTESKNYNIYLKRFKEVSDELGRALMINELTNNKYGLPSAKWLVDNCPDKSVKTYDSFVQWCGYDSNKLKLDEEYVGNKLIELEKKLGRHITKNDITLDNVGFSGIVITRIYGSLKNAKEKLGLLPTPTSKPLHPFEYYRSLLEETLYNIYDKTGRKNVAWNDLESGLYSDKKIEHKTITNAFKREGMDVFSYIKTIGFEMNPNTFSYKYTFDDGERTTSTMEFDFSTFIRSIGFEYDKTYYIQRCNV